MVVLFRICNNTNCKAANTLLLENIAGIEKHARERVGLRETLLNAVDDFSIKVRISLSAMIECIVCIIKIQLSIQRLLAIRRKKSSSRVVNLVASSPHLWTAAIEMNIVVIRAERGECKVAIVLLNMLTKVSCLYSLIRKKRTNH
jgi:hypothetical protein